jgi:hypothetical protein
VIVCDKCHRRGDYGVEGLRAKFGAKATLIKIREKITADCPSRKNYGDYCGAKFEGLSLTGE